MPYTNWRYFAGICVIPALLAFLLTYFILPESPRYLLEKIEFEKVTKALNDISIIQISSTDLINEFYIKNKNNIENNNEDNYENCDNEVEINFENINNANTDINKNNIHTNVNNITSNINTKNNRNNKTTYKIPVIFTNKKLKYLTFILMIIWFTLSFGSYGITTWVSRIFVDKL